MSMRTFVALLACCFCQISSSELHAQRPPVVVTDRALQVLRECYVFDGHNDLPWALRSEASSSFEIADLSHSLPQFHTDLPRLKKANVGAQFWSVYVPVETAEKGEALQTTLEQIELVEKMVARYPESLELALSASDVKRIQASGKIASLIGVEGGHSIEDSLENLRRLYRRGARYMTLSHATTLDWVDSATDAPRHGGLNAFGEEVVREMNRLGMLVDLSHVSVETMIDAMKVSEAPIMFSHSSARAVADHPRNVPDDVLSLMSGNGGIVMVNFFSGFVVPESAARRRNMFQVIRDLRSQFPEPAEFAKAKQQWELENPIVPGTVHDVVDHIEHIAKVAGIDHVGLGSDFDGVPMLPKQLEDVTGYVVIIQALLDRGYSKIDIQKIMHGNMLRVLQEAENTAARLGKS